MRSCYLQRNQLDRPRWRCWLEGKWAAALGWSELYSAVSALQCHSSDSSSWMRRGCKLEPLKSPFQPGWSWRDRTRPDALATRWVSSYTILSSTTSRIVVKWKLLDNAVGSCKDVLIGYQNSAAKWICSGHQKSRHPGPFILIDSFASNYTRIFLQERAATFQYVRGHYIKC
jgi:hypothetical protein